MEKNGLLVSCAKIAVLVLAIPSLFSCSIPRIVVLNDPLTAEEHINLGITWEKRKDFDRAIAEYKVAARSLPIAYLYLGNACFQKDAVQDAEKYYRKAIDKTNNPQAYNNLAWLYYTKRMKLDEAEELALAAVERAPGENGYRDTLDKIRAGKGNTESGRQDNNE